MEECQSAKLLSVSNKQCGNSWWMHIFVPNNGMSLGMLVWNGHLTKKLENSQYSWLPKAFSTDLLWFVLIINFSHNPLSSLRQQMPYFCRLILGWLEAKIKIFSLKSINDIFTLFHFCGDYRRVIQTALLTTSITCDRIMLILSISLWWQSRVCVCLEKLYLYRVVQVMKAFLAVLNTHSASQTSLYRS